MGAIVNHLSEIITVFIAIISAVYTVVKILNNLRDRLLEEKIDNIKRNIVVLERDILDIQTHFMNNEDVRRINTTIAGLNDALTELKHTALKKGDVERVHMRMDDIAKILQSTREEMVRDSILDEVEEKNIQDTFNRLQRAVNECTDCRKCDYIKNNGVERRSRPHIEKDNHDYQTND